MLQPCGDFAIGQAVNVTSRRSLAKALGYDNPSVFDDLKFIEVGAEVF